MVVLIRSLRGPEKLKLPTGRSATSEERNFLPFFHREGTPSNSRHLFEIFVSVQQTRFDRIEQPDSIFSLLCSVRGRGPSVSTILDLFSSNIP